MKISLSAITKYIPLVLSVIIITIGAFFVPWRDVWPYFIKTPPSTWIILLILGLVFFYGRVLRYWFLLRALGHPLRFDKVAIAYLEAQPVSLLPGGEFYRSAMFKRYGNVPHSKGIPGVFVQSITENLGMIVLALIAAIILNRYIAVAFLILIGLSAWIALIRWHSTRRTHKLINKLPKITVNYQRLSSFMNKNRELLSGKNFIMLLLTSFIAAVSGTGILWVLAHAYGSNLGIPEATLAFTLPIVIQSVTFLPAGIGANEQSSVGILALFGMNLPLAVAVTLVVRLITLVLGIVLGLIASAFARAAHYKTYRSKTP